MAVTLSEGDRALMAGEGLRLMRCYESMGCRPIWTCAPYQTEHGPRARE